MEEVYIAFKEKCVIHAEAQFDEESFKTACPDIYHHISTCNWGPFTIPVDPYLPELVWEFYASYRSRQQLLKRRGSTEAFSCLTSICVRGRENTSEVPIKVSILLSCIMDHVHINVGEIIADQFKWKAKQQDTSLPFPNLVSMLCMWAACPLLWPLDRTVKANSVITLATKIDKEAPVMKRAKYTGTMTPPSSSASTHNATTPLHTIESQNPPLPELLNIAQRAKMNENQLVRLAKALPSMIQGAIKKALQPAKDKYQPMLYI
ncbi:hypothetical protein HAX54_049357 [Datura stramonium]|uniref:Uncharacterized protein n=1 Tax=Datura stramonium TaxID=4076 RepID=A0ABS8SVM2_DATST|nr:hypothetical protein [Datura stramonium]